MRIRRERFTGRQFHQRLQRQRELKRNDLERADRVLLGGEGLFKTELPKFNSIDELLLAGNQRFNNLDAVDFSGLRNDKKLGRKVLAEVREEVAKLGGSPADVRRVFHGRYLQAHGVQLHDNLGTAELVALRRYLQTQDTSYNIADAVRGLNQSLAARQSEPDTLIRSAERFMYADRGVDGELFETTLNGLELGELKKLRDFSDAWSTSQGGRFLRLAARSGESFEQMRDGMARGMLGAQGYELPAHLELTTVLSLLRDVDPEGPRTNATLRVAINKALNSGERDYFELSRIGNEAVLAELGLKREELDRMAVSDAQLQEAYPEVSPAESRAIRTRVLRDLLRVLHDSERSQALSVVAGDGVNLINAEARLDQHFDVQLEQLTGLGGQGRDMGAQQSANFLSGVSRLPETLRGGWGDSESFAKDALERAIESEFRVEVHRQPGQYPGEANGYDPYVSDWSLQGLVDLHNGLSAMQHGDQLPPGLAGTTTLVHMVGAPTSPSLIPGITPEPSDVGPWNRPGAWAHAAGKSGFYGEATYDDLGHDLVVLYDDALYAPNGDGVVGVNTNEATLVHELGHAVQLGGKPGQEKALRLAEERKLVAEWSSLSRWQESDGKLADGYEHDFNYYYNPSVQVGRRNEVATSYGASDPVEDFAEFSPFFFHDPDAALGLSPAKFLYFNNMAGGHYSQQQIRELAAARDISVEELVQLEDRMLDGLARAPGEAGL